MEGLGAAASVIAVIQITTKVVSLSYGYIGGVRRASSNLQRLVDELKSLTGILTTLQTHAQDPRSMVLQQLDVPLRQYKLEMVKLHDKLESKRNVSSWWGVALVRLQWPFGEAETLGFILEIERFKISLILAMNTDQLPRSIAMEEKIQKIDESRQNEDTEKTDKKRTEVLNWIFPESFEETHIKISSRRKQGTGQWVLLLPEVQIWHKNPGILWGYGIPGAGKTFLSSLMIDNLQSQAKRKDYGVAYIYFNYTEQGKQRPTYVLASLVKQLSCQTQHLSKELEELHDSLARQEKRPTMKELYATFLGVSKLFARVYMVFDALDECGQRKDLLPLFHQMGSDGVHLFITSREYPEDIQRSFENTPKTQLWARDEDIARYIEQKILETPRAERLVAGGQGNYKEKIIAELISCAKGMFLLVHFHIEYLCKQTTIRQILEELEKLKSSSAASSKSPLHPTYDRAMEILYAQPTNCSELAIRILSWLVKARRVLSVRELQLAVSVEQHRTTFDELDLPDLKTMLDVCASLVTYDEDGDTIRLVHYTAQEYLLQHPTILQHANFKVAMTCLVFLSSKLFSIGACISADSLRCRLKLYPFFLYACRHLSFHLSGCKESLSKALVLRFIRNPGSTCSYLQALYLRKDSIYGIEHLDYCEYDKYPKQWTPLHIACGLGHYSAIKVLLEDNADISAADNDGMTPFHIASDYAWVFGSTPDPRKTASIIYLLFEKNIGASEANTHRRTGTHIKAPRAHREAVQTLLRKEINIDIAPRDKDGRMALHNAVIDGKEDLVTQLLEKGADISATAKDGRTALHYATRPELENLAIYLVVKGANISATDNDGRTALHYATIYGMKDLVTLLARKGADILATDRERWCEKDSDKKNSRYPGVDNWHQLRAMSDVDGDGDTALYYANKYGDKDMVNSLFTESTYVSGRDKGGRTMLHYAAIYSQDSLVHLVEQGADISATDKKGRTALAYAIIFKRKYSVAYLIEKGADISAADPDGRTVFNYATEPFYSFAGGDWDIAGHLVDFGADISAIDKDGRTALHLAAREGLEGLVVLLIEKGTDISAMDNYGRTALHYAIHELGLRHISKAKDPVFYLIDQGADISATDEDGKTALHFAVTCARHDLVIYLVEMGALTSATDKTGRTALHYAAENRHKDSLVYLIDKGADISAAENDGKTVLHFAIIGRKRCKDSVVYLIENGADILAIDKYGKTALHYAAGNAYGGERFNFVAYLLEKGADISTEDHDGKTALHHAAAQGSKDTVAYLLGKGADISVMDRNGKTAFDYAGRLEISKLLLENSFQTSTAILQKTATHEPIRTGSQISTV